MADAGDLKSSIERCVGSNPSPGTKNTNPGLIPWIFFIDPLGVIFPLLCSSYGGRMDL